MTTKPATTRPASAPAVSRGIPGQILRRLEPFALPVVLLLGLEIAARLELAPFYVIPRPSLVAESLFRAAETGILWQDTWASLYRVLGGYVLGVVVGLSLGFTLGWFRSVAQFVDPIVQWLRPIPPIAYLPLVSLWFGFTYSAMVAVVFVGAVFPIFLTSAYAIGSMDRSIVEYARTLGASSWHLFLRVFVPASLPTIFTGLRIAIGVAWITIVAAELPGANTGLGARIFAARNMYDINQVVAMMVVLGLIGLILDLGMRKLEGRLFAWRKGIVHG